MDGRWGGGGGRGVTGLERNVKMTFLVGKIDMQGFPRIKVESSAYWLIFHSLFPTRIPFIFFSARMIVAKISTHIIKRYVERGHPCLNPLSKLKNPYKITLSTRFMTERN